MNEKGNDSNQTGNIENNKIFTQKIEQLESENQRLHIEVEAMKLAREGLREGQSFLQEVLKSQAETFVFILDENYVINFAWGPKRLEKFYSITFNNYIGKSPDEYLRELPLEVKIEAIRQVFKTGKIVGKEIEIEIPSGHVWWHIDLSPMKDDDGRIAAVIATIRDITVYKNAGIIIQKERDKAQSYLDLARVMIIGIDTQGTVKLVNKKGCEVLGYEESEIIGKNWFDNFLPERIRDEIISISNKLLSDEIEFIKDYEKLILTKNGKEKLIAWHNSVLKDDEGKIIGFLSSGEDITDRNKAEEKLKESEERYRLLYQNINEVILNAKLQQEKAQKKLLHQSMLLENISEAIISTDLEMNILTWNSAAQKIFGWKSEEVIGKNFDQIVQPKFHITSREKIDTYLTNLGFWSGEVIKHKHNGAPVQIFCSISMLKDEQGNLIGYVRVNSDISEQKEAENKLKESEINLKKAQKMAQIGHWNVDLATKEVSGSDEFFRIFNLKHDEISLDTFVEVVHPDDREYDLYHIKRGMEYGESWNIEHRLITKDGTEKWVNARGEAIRDEKGNITKITGITQDITERKRLEKSIVEEHNLLKTTEEALRESSGIMLAILENSPDYIIMTDSEGAIQFINRPFTGMNKGDLHNNKIYDIITPEYHKIVKDRISQMFLYGRAEKVKVNIRDPLGFFTLYEVQFGNIKRDWNIIGVIINFTDITESKKMDKSIKENEEIYRNLFKNSAIGLGVAYPNGEILDINEACSKITGYTVEDLNEIGPSALYANQEDYQRLLRILQEKGEVNNFVVKFRNIQGNGYWVMISVRSIIYKEKKAFLSSILDITELITAKEEIIESE